MGVVHPIFLQVSMELLAGKSLMQQSLILAVASHVATIGDGRYILAGGTSASAPIIASLINRVNEERIRAGKGPVGFIST